MYQITLTENKQNTVTGFKPKTELVFRKFTMQVRNIIQLRLSVTRGRVKNQSSQKATATAIAQLAQTLLVAKTSLKSLAEMYLPSQKVQDIS